MINKFAKFDNKKQKITNILANNSATTINACITIYLIVIFLIIFSDLGRCDTCAYLSGCISEIIPSISKTAIISADNKTSELVLSISWLLVLPTSILLLLVRYKFICDYFEDKKLTSVLLFSISIVLLIYFLSVFVPDKQNGIFNLIIYKTIGNYKYGIEFWGFIVWLFVSLSLFYIEYVIALFILLLVRR